MECCTDAKIQDAMLSIDTVGVASQCAAPGKDFLPLNAGLWPMAMLSI